MFEKLRAKFAHTDSHETNLPTSEVAWSEAESFAGKAFPKYDPDSLRSWKGYKVYQEMMRDEQVKAVVRFRRDSVTGRDWYFNWDSDLKDELGEDEADRRVALFNFILKKMRGTLDTRLNGIMSASTHGFSLSEKVFNKIEWQGRTWWGIKHLRLKPYHTFEFYVDEFGNLDKIEQRTSGSNIQIDPSRMIHFVQNPDVDEQFGESELNAAYRSWYAKDIIIKLQSIYLERYAGGFITAQPKMNSNKSIRRGTAEFGELTAVLKSLQTKTAVFLPEWLEMNHYQPGATDAFGKAISQHDKAIAKALLVPNLLGISEQGSTGSYSQSQTQLEAFLWLLEGDAKRLEECLNEQLFSELGDANFGDGMYPEFRFRELSNSMITQILSTWNQLAASGAVERTDADEAYVRDLLGFPGKPETEDEGSEQVRPDSALNGQQVEALLKITERVAAGTLSKETAVEIIVATFPIGIEQAQKIVDGQEVDEQPPRGAGEAGDPEQNDEDMTDHDDHMDDDDEDQGSTIIGRPAFTRALRRVDFAAIDTASQTNQWEGEDRLGMALDAIVEHAEDQIREGQISEDPEEAEGFKPMPSQVKAVRKAIEKTMVAGWELGQLHARREIRKSGFNRKGAFKTIKDFAMDYIAARSTSSTSKVVADLTALVDNVLLSSIKYGWSDAKTIDELYSQAASAGFITQDLADSKLKDLAGDVVPFHRQQTIIRTVQFEAINESRKAFFEDEALGGFVVAYEYSAILDSRTTDICRELETGANGGPHIHPVDSAFWDQYRPPNHFNCRSLLIPITQDDEWEETTSDVAVKPQQGFKRDEPAAEPIPPVINITLPEINFPEPKAPIINFDPVIKMPEQKFTAEPAKSKTRTINVKIGDKEVKGTISDAD